MSDERLIHDLRALDRPVEPDLGFAESLFATLELERARRRRGRNPSIVLLAAALLLVLVVGATLAVGSGLIEVPWMPRHREVTPVPPTADQPRIGFVDAGEIWTVNLDGSGLRQLTDGKDLPTVWPIQEMHWSPDGQWLAFATEAVFIMRADGTEVRQLTEHQENQWDFAIAWHPDGTQLAFIREGIGTPNADGGNARLTLHTVGAGGGPVRQVPVDLLRLWLSPPDIQLAWSLNKWDVLLVAPLAPDAAVDSNYRGLAIDVATGRHRQLPIDVNLLAHMPHGSYGYVDGCSTGFDWSPDRTRIAYCDVRPVGEMPPSGGTVEVNPDIYVVDDEGNETRLTTHPGRDHQPRWSPDGSLIAFLSERDGPVGIYVMNADGTDIRRVTTGLTSPNTAPSWSPGP